MRFTLLLLPVVLLTGCAMQPSPVPDSWPKRYKAFFQEEKLPLGFRLNRYLGSVEGESSRQIGTQEAIVVQFAPSNPISSVTIRFDDLKGGVYVGKMWTDFNSKALCVSFKQLSEIGVYKMGIPIVVHGSGPDNFFVRMDHTPDRFVLTLDDGTKLEEDVRFEQGCLARLVHRVTSRSDRW